MISLQIITGLSMTAGRILIAEEDEALTQVSAALAGYEILAMRTRQEAERMLIEAGVDLCVIGINFDHSNALNLVQFIRDSKEHKKTPIILTSLAHSGIAASLRDVLLVLVKAQNISDYLELSDDLSAQQKIRSAVEKHLPSEKRLVNVTG